MLTQVTRFQALLMSDKIEFFAKCQELLVKHHPTSEFVLTRENFEERKDYALDFIKRYKGFAYADDNVCVLFNKVRVEDPKNPVKVIKDHLYQEPREIDYNAVSVDFVVFRQLEDCIGFCRAQYRPQMEYVVFVRHNEVKLYPTKRLLEGLSASHLAYLKI